jgi:hypothetical protein
MYYHEDMTHRVDWNPEYEAEAAEAMSEIVAGFDSTADAPIQVDLETAKAVNARYRELIEPDPDTDTTGQEPDPDTNTTSQEPNPDTSTTSQ